MRLANSIRSGLALLAVLGGLPGAALAADEDPPRIVHAAVTEAAAGAPLKLVADILDDSEIFEPKLHYRLAGTGRYLTMSMLRGAEASFSATIPDTATTGDLEYFIEAYDEQGNGPGLFASETHPQLVKVNTAPNPPALAAEAATPPRAEDALEPAAVLEERDSPSPKRPPLHAAGIAAAVGAAAAGAGIYFGTRVLDASVSVEDSRSAATGATVCFSVAGVAGAVAAALAIWHFAPGGPATEDEPSLGLFVGPQGLALSGRF